MAASTFGFASVVLSLFLALPGATHSFATAHDTGGRTIRVGPNGDVRTIAEAAAAARDGDIVEVHAGTYKADVAVWLQSALTIRAVGGRAQLVAGGAHAEGTAIWVIRNGDFTIEGFDFIGARVPDRNGAGIRFERGNLVVRDSRFLDNQMGLLTENDRSSRLTIELLFDGLLNDGICDRGVDRLTRLEHNADGFIALNGGGGEIFRNFFHLPDRAYRAIDIVRSFYRGFDPAVFRSGAALRAYEDRLAASIARSVGLRDVEEPRRQPLTREQVDLVLVRQAVTLPLAWKNAGAFESRLIADRHRGVAQYGSSYGFRIADGPDARARRSEWFAGLRPAALREVVARELVP